MRVTVAGRISEDVSALIEEEVAQISGALRTAVERSSSSLQQDLRNQVRAAGLGAALANAWRRETYPRGRRKTLRPAGLVYSSAAALHDAFSKGAVILPRAGAFLLVPTPAAERLGVTTTSRSRKGGSIPGGRGRRLSDLDRTAAKLGVPIVSARPSEGQPRRGSGSGRGRGFILLTPARRSRSNLVALYFSSRAAEPVHLFTLVRTTRVRKLLDIEAAIAKAETDFGAAVASAMAAG